MMSQECDTIRTFWFGSQLSLYEKLSIQSFLNHGHTVEVFSYDSIELPVGVLYRDAREILPRSEVFFYKKGAGKGSVAAFSNIFRYKMLFELGGTWVDTDIYCLKSFSSLPRACVGKQDPHTINTAVMRFPAKHPVTKMAYERAKNMGKDLKWGQTGPQLLTSILSNASDSQGVKVLPENAFYPVKWTEAQCLIDPDECTDIMGKINDSYCVHWWNEIIRRIGVPKEKLPPSLSWIGRCASDILPCDDVEYWTTQLTHTWIANYSADKKLKTVEHSVNRCRNLGIKLYNEHKYEQARGVFTAALMLRPSGKVIRYYLVLTLIALKEREAAKAELIILENESSPMNENVHSELDLIKLRRRIG